MTTHVTTYPICKTVVKAEVEPYPTGITITPGFSYESMATRYKGNRRNP